MRKNLRLKHVCSPTNHHPNFIWNLFNILKHNHWRFIKKRLPHKRLVRRYAAAKNSDNNIKPSYNEDSQDHSNAKANNVERKSKRHISEEKVKKNTETKSSVKARIKALITDEKCKRKSKHKKSLTDTESLQEFEFSDDQNDEYSRTYNPDDITSPAFGSLNPLYLMSEESSSSDSEEHNINQYNKKVKFVENEEQLVLSDGKRAFFDALNLINMNKDFLLKVLQDPGSPLARHFQSQQTLSAKTVLKKQGSFPEFGTEKEIFESDMIKKPKSEFGLQEKFDFAENADDGHEGISNVAAGIEKLNESKSKAFSENNSSGSGIQMRKRGRNQMVIKRFKDLRQKIRQESNKESKNEKHRIAMDAVLHKLPCKNGFSKDLNQETLDQFKEQWVDKTRKSGLKKLKHSRTTSLNGSLDRYLQLYDCSFSREGKNQETEKSNLGFRSKNLGRILSMPEMKSSYSYKAEEFTGTLFSVKELDETAGSRNLDEEIIESEEESLLDVPEEVQEYVQRMDFDSEDEEGNYERNISDCYEHETDSEMEALEENEEERLSLDEPVPMVDISQEESYNPNVSTPIYSNQVVLLEDASNSHQDTIPISNKQEHSNFIHDIHVEAEDIPKFDYIRDILEQSGFSSPESATAWHSDFQFVDPLIYEEATGCLFCDPNCSAYYEGGNCTHLLLFDLINEVLMEIYERYYNYCAISLSGLCRIHPMPIGFSMLKQVWVRISWYLRLGGNHGEKEKSVECIVNRDLWRLEGWMNLQFDSECVGIEVEDLIFDQLLEELILD